MDDSLVTIQTLLRQIAEHLQSPARSQQNAAAAKLHQMATVASTLAFTVEGAKR